LGFGFFTQLEEERVGSAELAVVTGFIAMLEVKSVRRSLKRSSDSPSRTTV
jgi:hypothetical protein